MAYTHKIHFYTPDMSLYREYINESNPRCLCGLSTVYAKVATSNIDQVTCESCKAIWNKKNLNKEECKEKEVNKVKLSQKQLDTISEQTAEILKPSILETLREAVDRNMAKVSLEKSRISEPPKDTPRQLTSEEMRNIFLAELKNSVYYWHALDKPEIEKLNGLAFSILSTLDGSSPNLPNFLICPDPHAEDVAYRVENGQNWWPSPAEEINVSETLNGEDELHHHWANYIKG